jgi:hypothetical protein
MLPIFSSRFSPMFPMTFQKIAARRMPMHWEYDSSWLLPHVCIHSVHKIRILILFLLYSEIFSKHQSLHTVFPNVLSVCAGAFTELDHDATKNVIGAQSATPQPFVVQVPWIPLSTTTSISCPICIQIILLTFYIHTYSQSPGTFSYFR